MVAPGSIIRYGSVLSRGRRRAAGRARRASRSRTSGCRIATISRGEDGGVGRARLADRERADGHALGHLHDREQRVDAVEHGRGDRHAEHGHEGLRRDHSREVRRTAGGRDDHQQTRVASAVAAYSNIQSGVRCADTTARLVRHLQLVEQRACGREMLVVALAAHDHANERRWHRRQDCSAVEGGRRRTGWRRRCATDGRAREQATNGGRDQ